MSDRPVDTCVECGRGDGDTPLLALAYRGARVWICPQHLPILIHSPAKLAGKLAGAERLRPADGHG
jgi:hypothetical protein